MSRWTPKAGASKGCQACPCGERRRYHTPNTSYQRPTAGKEPAQAVSRRVDFEVGGRSESAFAWRYARLPDAGLCRRDDYAVHGER